MLPSIVVAAFMAGYLVHQINSLSEAQKWIDHSDQAISQVLLLQKLMLDAETGVRGFILTRDPVTLNPFLEQRRQFTRALDSATVFVQDNPQQVQRVERIRHLFSDWISHAQGIESHSDLNGMLRYFGVGEGRKVMDACRQNVDEFLAAELALRASRERQIKRRIPRVILSSVAATLLLRILGVWILRKVRQARS